jgi:hypothetical protein
VGRVGSTTTSRLARDLHQPGLALFGNKHDTGPVDSDPSELLELGDHRCECLAK